MKLYDQVTFTGRYDQRVYADRPLPKFMLISRDLLDLNVVEVRPLTLTNLVKAVAGNLVFMSKVRFYRVLLRLGMLVTELGYEPRLSDIRLPRRNRLSVDDCR